jgi:hypothetical protein
MIVAMSVSALDSTQYPFKTDNKSYLLPSIDHSNFIRKNGMIVFFSSILTTIQAAYS